MKGAIAKITIGFAALALLGCQNPVNRESNPIKKYNGLNFDVPKGQETPAENDGPKTFCGRVFSLTITDADGKDAGRALRFIANEAKTYKLKIESDLNPLLSLAGAPSGLNLKKKSDADYELTWKPTDRQANSVQDVKIVAQVEHNQCTDGVVYETVTMNVNMNGQQPTVKVTGLDSFKTYGSNEKINFSVTVFDPSLAAGAQPQEITITGFDKNPTGEVAFLNARDSIACAKPQSLGGSSTQSFVFNCTLDVATLVAKSKNTWSGLTALEISTKSTSGEPSVPMTKEIRIATPKAAIQTGANL